MGTESVWTVATDEQGRMSPEDLRRRIHEARAAGALPYLVVATCGTTVLAAYDPLHEIADVCASELTRVDDESPAQPLWLHVDAAQGGAALFSPTYRSLMAGVERCDSITWDWHKMTCVPLQNSVILTRHARLLMACNSITAEYIFQADKYYDRKYDSGDKSIQCGRKADSLKAWYWLAARGTNGVRDMVDAVWERAATFVALLKQSAHRGFILAFEPEANNIAFWYVPAAWRDGVRYKSPSTAAVNGVNGHLTNGTVNGVTNGVSTNGATNGSTHNGSAEHVNGNSDDDGESVCRDMRERFFTLELADKLHQLAPAMKAVMMKRGRLMIGYQPLASKRLPNFWRLTLTGHPPVTDDDLRFVLDEIETIGELAVQQLKLKQ